MYINSMDVIQILLMLGACWACFLWGRTNGIELTVGTLLHKQIITEEDLERMND